MAEMMQVHQSQAAVKQCSALGRNQIELALGRSGSGEFVSDAIWRQKNVIRIAEVNTADLILYEDGATNARNQWQI